MSKGGGTTTTVNKLPPQIEAAASQNIDIADEVASMGYIPYQGPMVAGFSPGQLASMQGVNQASEAFGMPQSMGQNVWNPNAMQDPAMVSQMTGTPPPNSTSGGFSGYSPFSIYEDQINNIPPAQKALIESFIRDPLTGAAPTNRAVPPVSPLHIPPRDARNQREAITLSYINQGAPKHIAQYATGEDIPVGTQFQLDSLDRQIAAVQDKPASAITAAARAAKIQALNKQKNDLLAADRKKYKAQVDQAIAKYKSPAAVAARKAAAKPPTAKAKTQDQIIADLLYAQAQSEQP